jgi:hypothetical protein
VLQVLPIIEAVPDSWLLGAIYSAALLPLLMMCRSNGSGKKISSGKAYAPPAPQTAPQFAEQSENSKADKLPEKRQRRATTKAAEAAAEAKATRAIKAKAHTAEAILDRAVRPVPATPARPAAWRKACRAVFEGVSRTRSATSHLARSLACGAACRR